MRSSVLDSFSSTVKRRWQVPNLMFGIFIVIWACGMVLIFALPVSSLTVVIGVVFALPLIIALALKVVGGPR
jgi:hypothetical protein